MKSSVATLAVASLTTLAVAAGSLPATAQDENIAPSITINNKTVKQDATLTFDIAPKGNDPEVTFEGLPSWLEYDGTKTLTGKAEGIDWGDDNTKTKEVFTVTATVTDKDDEKTASDDFTITVERTKYAEETLKLDGTTDADTFTQVLNYKGQNGRTAILNTKGEVICDTEGGTNNFSFTSNCVKKSPLDMIKDVTAYITAIVAGVSALVGLYTTVAKFVPDMPSIPGLPQL